METIELPVVSVTQSDGLDKIVLDVALKDLPYVVRTLSSQLLAEQVRLGNPPTNIIVDGSGKRPITEAKRRVQAFFADKEAVRRAVEEAWTRIQQLTRVKSGRAAASYEVWFNNKKIGNSPAAVSSYLDRMDPSKDFFRIVGPVLVYGRKIYWNPRGKPRFRTKRLFKLKTGTEVRLKRIRGIMDQVKTAMRRRYRFLAISESWVQTTALPKDGRTPAMFIGFKRRGTTLPRIK